MIPIIVTVTGTQEYIKLVLVTEKEIIKAFSGARLTPPRLILVTLDYNRGCFDILFEAAVPSNGPKLCADKILEDISKITALKDLSLAVCIQHEDGGPPRNVAHASEA